jgi:hypothetical protein
VPSPDHRPPGRACRRFAPALLIAALMGHSAHAEGPRSNDDSWMVSSKGDLTLDGGFVLATPAALETGISTGVGAGAAFGRRFALGLRGEWSSATESSLAWTVTQSDFKLRATVALQAAAGRGRFALRLGLGPTVVYETRLRNQGMRAGLTGSDLETRAFSTLPAANLDGVIAVHIAGRWLLTMSGGPALTIIDGRARLGWTAQLGAGWQP